MELNIAAFMAQHRWKLFTLSFVLISVCLIGILNLKVTSDIRTIMDEDHKGLIDIDRFAEDFDIPRNFLVFIHHEEGQLNPRTLALIDQLTLKLETGPAVTSVRSLANSTYIFSEHGDIYIEYIHDRDGGSNNSLTHYKEIEDWLVKEPTLSGSFISDTSKMSAIVVNTWLDQSAQYSLIKETQSFILDEVKEFSQQNPDYRVVVSGDLSLDIAFSEALTHDIKVNLMLSMLFIFIILLIQFRSILSASFVFLVSVFACISALGLAGFAGININNINITAPIIIVVVSVLDGIHFFSTYQRKRVTENPLDAVKSSIELTLKPITLTTITTATGFIALNTSSSPAISSLGNIAAVGIIMAWIFTFGLLSSLVVFTGGREKKRSGDWIDKILMSISTVVHRHPSKIIITFIALLVLTLTQIPRIKIDDNHFNSLDKNQAYSQSHEFVRDHMSSGSFNIYIDTGKQRGIHQAKVLSDIDQLSHWVKQQEGVVNAYSYVDHMKRINQVMNGGESRYYRVPEENDLVAQYGLLYQLSIPSPDELFRYTDINEQKIALNVLTYDISRGHLNSLVDDIRDRIKHIGLEEYATVTGWLVVMDAEVMNWVTELLNGFALAFLIISLQMFIYFKSFKMGLVSLVPNILPIVIVFGLWGALQWPLDFISLLVLSASFGIVIDDTIHFMTKYLDHINKGRNTVDAIEHAYRFSGRAIIITTLALTIGASPMLFSTLTPMQSIVKLIGPIIFFALIVDLFLLPAILIKLAKRN